MNEVPESLKVRLDWYREIDNMKKPTDLKEHIDLWIKDEYVNIVSQSILAQEVTESPIEAILYLHLMSIEKEVHRNEEKITITPQKQIDKYRVDFLVEYKNRKIVIECDGHEFHEKTKEQVARDRKRDRKLTMFGFTVIHFTGHEITHDINSVVREIEEFIYDESYERDQFVESQMMQK